MTIDRRMINSGVLALLVWFMRRDMTLALAVAIVSYVLTMF